MVMRGGWLYKAAIHEKEARVELLGLRRVARNVNLHGLRVLSIGDNMAAVLAYEKGRARDPVLRSLVARSAAYRIGCEIRWKQRYVESKRNCTDHDSRAADRGEVGAGE
eukprot:14940011-Heterocapsa_arctica.AAC.1